MDEQILLLLYYFISPIWRHTITMVLVAVQLPGTCVSNNTHQTQPDPNLRADGKTPGPKQDKLARGAPSNCVSSAK